MATDVSKPKESADSYIGCLLSLTSNSDIRYEGVLFHLDTQESIIGVKNVRSFGTEGRRKNCPQVLPSDRVYECVYFRGSDVKDLQVISLPPVHSQSAIPNDPAIIQSLPHASSASINLASNSYGPVANLSSNTESRLSSSTLNGSLPLYRPFGNLQSSHSPPNVNVGELTMPTYWQGGPSGALSSFQHQSLLRPDPGLVASPPLQQQTQYPITNASLSSSIYNFPAFPQSLLPPITNDTLQSTSLWVPPSVSQTNFPVTQSPAVASNLSANLMPNNIHNAHPSVTLSSSLSLVSPLTTSDVDINAITAPTTDKTKLDIGPTNPSESTSHSIASVFETSNSNHLKPSVLPLPTPPQLMQSDPIALSLSCSSQDAQKDIQVLQESTPELLLLGSREVQDPIQPLPNSNVEKLNGTALHVHHRHRRHTQGRRTAPNGAALHAYHVNKGHGRGRRNVMNGSASPIRGTYRGRARGRGNRTSHPVTTFSEDFDFEAMNEKFNKDEVWDHLGKSNRVQLKPNKEDKKERDEENIEVVDEDEIPRMEIKPAYVKDDFFDSLSCKPVDDSTRAKVSEQRKLDVETFGNARTYRGGRGRWGIGHGGRRSGSYGGGRLTDCGRGRGRSRLGRIT